MATSTITRFRRPWASFNYLIGIIGIAALIVPLLAMSAQAEKVLRVGLQSMPPFKANAYSGNGPPGVFLWNALYDTLTDIDVTGAVQPMIAARWENVDPKTWRFHLRPNVKFHNGKPVTSRAVIEAVNFLIDDGGKLSVSRNIRNVGIAEIIAEDDLTFVIKTEQPNPIVPTQMAILPFFEPDHFKDVGIEKFTVDPVGTGPFALTEFTPNGADLTAFADYWRGRANIDRLVLQEIPEGPARVQALISEQIDIDIAVVADTFDQIRAAGGSIDTSPAPRVMGLSLVSAGQKDGRGKTTPFADKRVRRAVNIAVDRQAIIDNLLGGIGIPATSAATPGTFGYDKTIKPYPYDPEEARRLLAEAGYADGFDLLVTAIVTDPAQRLMYEQAVIDINRNTPIRAELTPITFATWLKNWQQGTWPGDAFGFGYFLAPEMDVASAFNFTSCKKKPEVSVYYCDEAEMTILAEAQKEFDPAIRKGILQKLLRVHFENSPILALIQTQDSMGVGPRVKNFKNVNLKLNYGEMDVED